MYLDSVKSTPNTDQPNLTLNLLATLLDPDYGLLGTGFVW